MALTGSIAVFVAAVGTAESLDQQRQAANQAKKARRAQQRINDLKEQRARRQTVREAIIKRGQLENVEAQTGAGDTSAASQAGSSISGQLSSNLSFLSQTGSLTQEISRRNQKSADATFRADRAGQVADLGFKLSGAGSGAGGGGGSPGGQSPQAGPLGGKQTGPTGTVF